MRGLRGGRAGELAEPRRVHVGRRADLAKNPRVAFSTWREDGAAAILYGRAREIPGSMREARAGRSGEPRKLVEFEVTLTRIYAMRPPERRAG